MDIRNEIKSYIVRDGVTMTKNRGKGRGRHRLHGGGAIPAIVAGKVTKPGTTKSSVTPAYEKTQPFLRLVHKVFNLTYKDMLIPNGAQYPTLKVINIRIYT